MRLFISRLILNFFCLAFFIMPLPVLSQTGEGQLKTVVIDPGHGGNDPGAVSGGIQEKNIVLAVALRLGNKIKKEFPDVKVVYTRSRDVFIPLYKRAAIAVKNKADVFISIHANYVDQSSVRGTETFTLGLYRSQENLEVAKKENSVILLEKDYTTNYQGFNPKETESYIMFENMQSVYQTQSIELAATIQNEFTSNLKSHNRGVKQAGFLVLRETSMPAVLIEIGFITNPQERRFLVSETGKEKVAQSVFRAFAKYKKTIDDKSRFNLNPANQTAAVEEDSGKNAERENIKDKLLKTDGKERNKPQITPEKEKEDGVQKNTADTVKPESISGHPIMKSEVKLPDSAQTVTSSKEIKVKTPPAKHVVNKSEVQPAKPENPVFYSLQIAAVANQLEPSPENFKGEKNIFRIKVHPYYKFYSGKFATFKDALSEKSRLANKFPDAFVVIVENNVPRPIYNK